MNIAILILAAGSSSRMGVAKQLLPAGDTTLLGIAINNALQTKVGNIYCVLGAKADEIQNSIKVKDIEFIINSDYKTGLSSSIKKGINHLQSQNYDAILMTLGDQPYVDFNILNEMINVFKTQPHKIIASGYGEKVGIPVIIPKHYYQEFLKLTGDKGAKQFLNNNTEQIVVFNNEHLMDIDTKEDYESYLKSII